MGILNELISSNDESRYVIFEFAVKERSVLSRWHLTFEKYINIRWGGGECML